MKILIAYASKYGCTEDCAKYLKQKLNQETRLLNLKKETINELKAYDWIIIGSPIYMGKIQKEVKRFCEDNQKELQKKNLAIYLSSTTPKEKENIFTDNFSSELLKHSQKNTNIGGELRLDRMKFLDKKITAMVAKAEQANKEEQKKAILSYESLDELVNIIQNKK